MRQTTGASRMLNLAVVSAAGLGGGGLAFTAVTGYLAWLPISIAMTGIAWWMWSPGNRRAFLALAVGCLAVGWAIHFLPHAPDGGVDGALTVVVVVLEGVCWFSWFSWFSWFGGAGGWWGVLIALVQSMRQIIRGGGCEFRD